MLTWVLVDGGFENSYGRTLHYPSAKPIVVAGDNLKIFFSEVMVIFTGVLHYRRLALTGTTKSGGEVLIYP